ncbi:hypothetical protein KEJ37_01870 [Candidatus Bathyarchaeota archaeon]|nr:hypothetical protein [Candidatus Bathyarchaeota archaeon]
MDRTNKKPTIAPNELVIKNPKMPPKKHRYMLLTFISSTARKMDNKKGILMKSSFNTTINNASSFASSRLDHVIPN